MRTPGDTGRKYSFDIERAIETWRQFLKNERSVSEDDLKELEAHLRDEIDHIRHPKMSEEEVYRRALQSLGDYATIGKAYRQVYIEKLAVESGLLEEIRWRSGLYKSYVCMAVRNLRREMFFSAVNVFGLSAGIAVFLLVSLYVRYERSYDRFHVNADRIYRTTAIVPHLEGDGWARYMAGRELFNYLRNSQPGVVQVVRTVNCGSDRIRVKNRFFGDLQMICTDSEFFDIFSFQFLEGEKDTSLSRPNSVVITESVSKRIFGNKSPLGHSIPIKFYGDEREFEVTGVVETPPPNSLFTFDIILSFASRSANDSCILCHGYVLLDENADPEAVSGQVFGFMGEREEYAHIEAFGLEPLTDIHFSPIGGQMQGDIRYVYLLSAIALMVLIIACSNYVNLSIARTSRRLREIGVRKVLGANRQQIAQQFLSETMLLTVVSLPIGLLILVALLPLTNSLANTDIGLAGLLSTRFWLTAVSLLVLMGFFAGAYPSLFLSSFSPVAALRGQAKLGFSGKILRRSLVIIQFAGSTLLITGTLIILAQLRFIQNAPLGFTAEQVIQIDLEGTGLATKSETIKQAFLKLPSVVMVTAATGSPGLRAYNRNGYLHQPGATPGTGAFETMISVNAPKIDSDFLETMGLKLLAGRNISDIIVKGETPEGLINRAGLRLFGDIKAEESLGREMAWTKIVGVVDDFNFQSFHEEIRPLVMAQNWRGDLSFLLLRVVPGNVRQTIRELEQTWTSFGTGDPLAYSFLTDDLNHLYTGEQRIARIFGLFSSLAILLACLGLFGLAALSVERRTKEIGIRKAVGASVRNIFILLSRELLWLVLVALLLAAPVVYWVSESWLDSFAYRITFGPILLLTTGGFVLVIALLSTSIQSIRAALANPINALRYE